MKAKLVFATLMIGFATFLSAQRGPYYGDRGYYEDRDHTSYYYNARGGGQYNGYDYYYRVMTRPDRRRLDRLIKCLRDEERRAFRDGYLSRRERRRLADVQEDIDRLISRYQRNRYNDRRIIYQRGCR